MKETTIQIEQLPSLTFNEVQNLFLPNNSCLDRSGTLQLLVTTYKKEIFEVCQIKKTQKKLDTLFLKAIKSCCEGFICSVYCRLVDNKNIILYWNNLEAMDNENKQPYNSNRYLEELYGLFYTSIKTYYGDENNINNHDNPDCEWCKDKHCHWYFNCKHPQIDICLPKLEKQIE